MTTTMTITPADAGADEPARGLPDQLPTDLPGVAAGTVPHPGNEHQRYARCVEVSKRIRWDIDADVIRGRRFDHGRRFLPDALSFVDRLPFLTVDEQRLLSQIQGRTYANMFGLVERFIGAKMLDLSRAHWLGDQVALEAIVRFADEELKHQALFRRVEQMIAAGMPAGYEFAPDPDTVAGAVLAASSWAVLALTCHIELFTQVHYRHSIGPQAGLCDIFRDIFLFHWKEESQHAIVDELEWRRVDAGMTVAERDQAVDELIALVGAVDNIVQAQAKADTFYFMRTCGRHPGLDQLGSVLDTVLAAYRWQYLVSGLRDARFNTLLTGMLNAGQQQRITRALAPLLGAARP